MYNKDVFIALRLFLDVYVLIPCKTGLSQINGRDELSLEQKVALEKEYLEKKSLLIDFQILIKTFTNVLFSKGVTH